MIDHLILRVPLLYGEVENLDENAVTILFKAIRNSQNPVKMDEYAGWESIAFVFVISLLSASLQTRYPTYVGDVAEVCLQLCDRRVKQASVVFLSMPFQIDQFVFV